MAKRNERHISPHLDAGWQVTRPGGSRALTRTETQDGAIDAGRGFLTNDGGGELIIHRPDGRIRDAETIAPGNDPFPPRDDK